MKNNKHYLPNKTTIFILGLLILGSLAYGIYYTKKKKIVAKPEKPKNIAFTLVKDKKNNDPFLDSDHDGAYDWVEELWPELDPHNPDSDGDGVLDGEYIKQKQRIYEKNRNKNSNTQTNLTETEKLGRSVYTALLALKNSGKTIDKNTQDQISNNIAHYISNLPLGDKLYIRDELKLVPDTKENSYAYRDAMLALFKKYPVRTHEINLIMKATKEPTKYKKEVETTTIKYNLYIHNLSEMKVPYLIAGQHIRLMNALEQIEGALKNLTSEHYDETIAISSLVQIKKTMEIIVQANIDIEKYFKIIADPSIFSDSHKI